MGIGRNSLKVYLSLRRLSFGEYLPFFRVDRIYVIFSSGLKAWLLPLLVQDPFRFLYPGSWNGTRILSRRPHLQTWFFLFPISAVRSRGLFPLWSPSQSFGFYLLPSLVRRFVRATIWPSTPFFTHPNTKYKHLLVSILTWICYFGIDLHYLS